MQRFGKTFVAWAVVLLTAVDPASACRFRRRCCPPPCCYTVCAPVNCCDGYSPATPQASESAPTPAVPPAPARQTPAAELPAPLAPAPSIAPSEVPAPEAPAALEEEMPFDEPAPTEAPTIAPEEKARAGKAAKPADDVEDLFKDTDATPKADALEVPAEPAGKADDVEDLFKDTDDKKSGAARPEAATEQELAELFSEPADDAVKSAGVEAAPATDAIVETQWSAAVEPANSMREWTDNTGNFKTTGRLVVVGDNSVRLLKDTGRFTTVPFERLSQDDLNFVRQQSATAVAGKF